MAEESLESGGITIAAEASKPTLPPEDCCRDGDDKELSGIDAVAAQPKFVGDAIALTETSSEINELPHPGGGDGNDAPMVISQLPEGTHRDDSGNVHPRGLFPKLLLHKSSSCESGNSEGQTWCDYSDDEDDEDDEDAGIFTLKSRSSQTLPLMPQLNTPPTPPKSLQPLTRLLGQSPHSSPRRSLLPLPDLSSDPSICSACTRPSRTFCRRCSAPLCDRHVRSSRSLLPPSVICFAPLSPPPPVTSACEISARQQAARIPLPTCVLCGEAVSRLQAELRRCNSNAVRYNAVDVEGSGCRRHFNSPLAFTLGHEVRKAAYALNNLLPRRDGRSATEPGDVGFRGGGSCRVPECDVDVNLSCVDRRGQTALLSRARGIFFLTSARLGLGIAVEYGTGLAIRRLDTGVEDGGDPLWSAPCAISMFGVGWGPMAGGQHVDRIMICMTEGACDALFSGEEKNGMAVVGAEAATTAGPVGRTAGAHAVAAVGRLGSGLITYSISRGLYIGAGLDGKVIAVRHGVNERFYGRAVDGNALLLGDVPQPPAAAPLYDALRRCHAYGSGKERRVKRGEEKGYPLALGQALHLAPHRYLIGTLPRDRRMRGSPKNHAAMFGREDSIITEDVQTLPQLPTS
eukprot:CAMPEP_0194318114 /NCGR_PEP_ID=MMETSP0171-20130528/14752_1 /TAXON_ID=218684 /ORGANISM="Corethron pennatum, Strain L29A3" /LENGTH=629 /DNA_ID=CAMNT_0039074923 /DNA_START=293 /DNA_END=2182 /DNA_ORIENTATION=+